MNKLTYEQIIEDVNSNFDLKIRNHGLGLSMEKHFHPISITRMEFSYIQNIIVEHNLKCGYEVATAFGISSLAAGIGFKQTNGKMVTMDAYIEEKYNDSGKYSDKYNEKYHDSDGFRLASFIHKYYNVNDNVHLSVGWSPIDTKKCLEQVFDLTKDKIDYTFIDAAHYDKSFLGDLASIVKFLSDKFIILIHDTPTFNKSTFEISEVLTGGKYKQIFVSNNDSYGLGAISNIL